MNIWDQHTQIISYFEIIRYQKKNPNPSLDLSLQDSEALTITTI